MGRNSGHILWRGCNYGERIQHCFFGIFVIGLLDVFISAIFDGKSGEGRGWMLVVLDFRENCLWIDNKKTSVPGLQRIIRNLSTRPSVPRSRRTWRIRVQRDSTDTLRRQNEEHKWSVWQMQPKACIILLTVCIHWWVESLHPSWVQLWYCHKVQSPW